jgi:group I intron endonuclease
MITTYIYALIDPRSKEIKYIGKSNNPRSRFYNHLLRDSGVFGKWIKELKSLGFSPELQILEEVLRDQWKERETYWIEKLSKECTLLNQTRGGDGLEKHKAETNTWLVENLRNSNLGRKHSQDTKDKRNKSLRERYKLHPRVGVPHTEEAKKKISENRKGILHSVETRALLSAKKQGWKPSREMVERAILANTGRVFTEEHKRKISLAKTKIREDIPCAS